MNERMPGRRDGRLPAAGRMLLPVPEEERRPRAAVERRPERDHAQQADERHDGGGDRDHLPLQFLNCA